MQAVFLAKSIWHCSARGAFLSNSKSYKYKCDSMFVSDLIINVSIALEQIYGVTSHVLTAGMTTTEAINGTSTEIIICYLGRMT